MPKCANCPKKGRLKGRGLCNSCHANIAVRYKFADLRAKPERPRCAAAGCPNAAKKGRRGLCKRCFENPALREAQADRRLKPLPADYSKRNAILENPDICQVAHLGQYAKMVRRRFRNNPRIDWQDLVQVGWLALIRAAERWNPEKGKTLTAFAGKTAMREMAHAARRELRSVTAGDTRGVDSGRQFKVSDMNHRVENLNELRQLVIVSDHALDRYRERVHGGATAEDVRRSVVHSVLAPDYVKAWVMAGGTLWSFKDRDDKDTYTLNGDAVFVIAKARDGRPAVKTVLSLAQLQKSVIINELEVGPI